MRLQCVVTRSDLSNDVRNRYLMRPPSDKPSEKVARPKKRKSNGPPDITVVHAVGSSGMKSNQEFFFLLRSSVHEG